MGIRSTRWLLYGALACVACANGNDSDTSPSGGQLPGNQAGAAGQNGGDAGQGGRSGHAGTGTAGYAGWPGMGGQAGTAGDAGTGGGGASGSAGSGGAAGTGGVAGSAGSAGTGGSAGWAGSAGAAGSAGWAGSAGAAGSAGSAGSAGTGGTGGSAPIVVAPTTILVDARSGPQTNGNGILEPNEVVSVEPAWQNQGTATVQLTGTASQHTGPGGATYITPDSSAAYGSITPGGRASCYAATGNCYQLGVVSSSTRPALHWDSMFVETVTGGATKQWTLHIGATFSDVPTTEYYYAAVEALVHHNITMGCGGNLFCPADTLKRSDAAMFLARAKAGGDASVPASGSIPGLGNYNCTTGGHSVFADVAPETHYCRHVHYLAVQNITAGCATSPPMYCPDDMVKRWQATMFVARALRGSDANVPATYTDPDTNRSYRCDSASPQLYFADVTATDNYCRHVHYLWARGVVSGCGGNNFCPLDDITRAPTAVLLARGFELSLY